MDHLPKWLMVSTRHERAKIRKNAQVLTQESESIKERCLLQRPVKLFMQHDEFLNFQKKHGIHVPFRPARVT